LSHVKVKTKTLSESKTDVKQAVLVFCPLNDIQKDDKTSTYSVGNKFLDDKTSTY
jgi:hypothetical protein